MNQQMFNWIVNTPYTCPLLMWAQSIIKRRQFWRWTESDGWVLLQSLSSRAKAIWPKWLILLECRFWNSRQGVYVRSQLQSPPPPYVKPDELNNIGAVNASEVMTPEIGQYIADALNEKATREAGND